jgi:hypothetical protein
MAPAAVTNNQDILRNIDTLPIAVDTRERGPEWSIT